VTVFTFHQHELTRRSAIRIILDTDLAMGSPGSEIDDGFALALAHADPELQIDIVTTVNGNTDVESATLLTLELMQRLGMSDVPVIQGASAPLTRPDLSVAAPPDIVSQYGHRRPRPGFAAAEIASHILAHPGEITIVAIGPLTNVATAIALDKRVASAVREIVLMGGIFLGQTHVTDMPGEFNVWVDPEAADAVMRSGAALRCVGLDVTLQVRLTREHAQQMAASSGSFGSFAGEYTLGWIDAQRERHPGDPAAGESCAMHDPLAVAVLSRPDLVTWQPAQVSVVSDRGVARGTCVTDLLSSAGAPPANCQIAVAVDVDAFLSHFLTSIKSL